jgi:hypothetical protein
MKFVTNINNLFASSKNIVLYFYVEGMNYHKKFVTMINSCEKDNDSIIFHAINIDLEKNMHLRFNFKSVPCLIFYSNDIEVYKHEGMLSADNLKKLINKFYNKRGKYVK